ncbi:MAG: glycoside hydrolase, partial [Muribaculaceae bacterium]|nr:glycoside hydrolase [Muribaculaceae bacterium]
GPWTHRGQVTGCPDGGFTIHPGVVDFNGKTYLFYHNAAQTINGIHGATGRRSVCVDELKFNPDGTIQFVKQTSR